jgi:Na+/proline symporter
MIALLLRTVLLVLPQQQQPLLLILSTAATLSITSQNAAHHRRTYGTLFEVLVSLVLCISFTFLLAGNFVGLARVLQFCFPAFGQTASVYVAAILTASYTIGGGLLSVVYTDVVMSVTGIFGLMLCAIYVLYGKDRAELAAAPSTGFPGCVLFVKKQQFSK